MLLALHIRNLALIERLVLEFAHGFNVITGETGAGKSMLVDALSLVLGGRARPELVRAGSEEAEVEALFAIGANDANAAFDSNMQPVVEEIRRHREALNFVRENATKRRVPITVDVVKRIYCVLHPEEGDAKAVKYRKDIPQHRLYFHEYAAPDKIAYKLRQVIDWINDPETRRTRTPVRLAARAHYDLLRIFPFTVDSGKVARLVMNLLLLRSGYPPAIIHSTERQRYYEALKGSSATMHSIVQDAIENSLASIEKLLDTYAAKPGA